MSQQIAMIPLVIGKSYYPPSHKILSKGKYMIICVMYFCFIFCIHHFCMNIFGLWDESSEFSLLLTEIYFDICPFWITSIFPEWKFILADQGITVYVCTYHNLKVVPCHCGDSLLLSATILLSICFISLYFWQPNNCTIFSVIFLSFLYYQEFCFWLSLVSYIIYIFCFILGNTYEQL